MKKHMKFKRIFSLALILALLCMCAACGGGDGESPEASGGSPSSEVSPSETEESTPPSSPSPSETSAPPADTASPVAPSTDTPPEGTPSAKPSESTTPSNSPSAPTQDTGNSTSPQPPVTSAPSVVPTPSVTPSAPASSPSEAPPSQSAEPSPSESSPPEQSSDSTDGGLQGTPEDILAGILAELMSSGVEMPMSMPPAAVAAEESQNTLGLSADDFNSYVTSAVHSMAGIGTFAHELILIEGKDADAAQAIYSAVSGDGGYNAGKWVCVRPEKAVAVKAGNYVFIAASTTVVADAAEGVFNSQAGGGTESVVFYTGVS